MLCNIHLPDGCRKRIGHQEYLIKQARHAVEEPGIRQVEKWLDLPTCINRADAFGSMRLSATDEEPSIRGRYDARDRAIDAREHLLRAIWRPANDHAIAKAGQEDVPLALSVIFSRNVPLGKLARVSAGTRNGSPPSWWGKFISVGTSGIWEVIHFLSLLNTSNGHLTVKHQGRNST